MTLQRIPQYRIRPTPLAVCVLTLLLTACTVTFISAYDETTDKDVTALSKSVDDLLNQLDQDPFPNYSSLKKTYDGIRSDLGAISLRNDVRPKNALTVKQLTALRQELKTLEDQHKAGTLNQAMVGPARNSLEQTFRAVLKLELAKKALDKTE